MDMQLEGRHVMVVERVESDDEQCHGLKMRRRRIANDDVRRRSPISGERKPLPLSIVARLQNFNTIYSS